MQGSQSKTALPPTKPAIQSPVRKGWHARSPRRAWCAASWLNHAPRRLGACHPRRRGFTLTELLIVIAIIGVLASLITAAAVNALRNAKRARILLEIKGVATALEDFKNHFGSYPPNAMNTGGTNPNNDNSFGLVGSDVARMTKQAFPRMHPAEREVFVALVGGTPNSQIVTDYDVENGMTAAEALFFWLGGFSEDPQYPLSGPGGPSFVIDQNSSTLGEVLEDRRMRYDFALERLGPTSEDGLDYDNVRHVTYRVDLNRDNDTNDSNELRRINLWNYRPSGSEQPLLYFDASRHKPWQYDMWATLPSQDVPAIFAFKQLREGFRGNNPGVKDIVFVNNKRYQLLHAGLDDAWGEQFELTGFAPKLTNANDVTLLFPEGPFIGDLADTLTNFEDGPIEDAAE